MKKASLSVLGLFIAFVAVVSFLGYKALDVIEGFDFSDGEDEEEF